ncbi:hypothetical protein VTN02DRAFT_4226 [Thermoascus thermophilus]
MVGLHGPESAILILMGVAGLRGNSRGAFNNSRWIVKTADGYYPAAIKGGPPRAQIHHHLPRISTGIFSDEPLP